MAYEILQKPLLFIMKKLLKLLRSVSRRASRGFDGAWMAYDMLQKPLFLCFYNEKAVGARIEVGLNEPRWSFDGI